MAKVGSLAPPGLVADDQTPLPGSREDLRDASKLDLAYANLRSGKSAGPAGRAEAKKAYERVLEDDPRNVEALLGLAWLTESDAGDRPGEQAEAEAAYRRAAEAAKTDARPQNALGRFLAARGRWDEAAAAFGRAADLAADVDQSRTAHYGLAVATAKGGDVAGSREHFVAAVGEASAAYNVGLLHMQENRRDLAEAEFRLAVAKDDGSNPELQKAHAALAALSADRPSRPGGGPAANARRLAAAPASPAPAGPGSAGDPFGPPVGIGAGPTPAAGTGLTPVGAAFDGNLAGGATTAAGFAPAEPARPFPATPAAAPVRRPAPVRQTAPVRRPAPVARAARPAPPRPAAPPTAEPAAPPQWPFGPGGA